jgi:phytanoyl-CoA hydroxylase
MTRSLDSARADYAREGYLIVSSLWSADECATLKAEALRVVAEHGRPNSSVFVGVAASSELFARYAADARLLAYLDALLPEGVAFMSDKVVFKSTSQSKATPWHTDALYWPGTRSKLSTWIPLDDASESNGTLLVVRGSHLKEWRNRRGGGINEAGDFGLTIDPGQWSPGDEVLCEVRRGSVIFFSDKLLHASSPNRTGADRYTIIGTYHAPVAVEEPFDLDFSARRTLLAH